MPAAITPTICLDALFHFLSFFSDSPHPPFFHLTALPFSCIKKDVEWASRISSVVIIAGTYPRVTIGLFFSFFLFSSLLLLNPDSPWC